VNQLTTELVIMSTLGMHATEDQVVISEIHSVGITTTAIEMFL
jgi:hypothetical protein